MPIAVVGEETRCFMSEAETLRLDEEDALHMGTGEARTVRFEDSRLRRRRVQVLVKSDCDSPHRMKLAGRSIGLLNEMRERNRHHAKSTLESVYPSSLLAMM